MEKLKNNPLIFDTMRKAAAIRRKSKNRFSTSSSNEAESSEPHHNSSNSNSNPQSNHNNHLLLSRNNYGSNHHRSTSGGGSNDTSTCGERKPSQEELALTAKNYRLAKELSDLRVRHREECKNVTRLTMENMNLASRCREAIGQVAALKKELTVLQQLRSRELKQLQHQQKHNQHLNSLLTIQQYSSSTVERSGSGATATTIDTEQSDHPQIAPLFASIDDDSASDTEKENIEVANKPPQAARDIAIASTPPSNQHLSIHSQHPQSKHQASSPPTLAEPIETTAQTLYDDDMTKLDNTMPMPAKSHHINERNTDAVICSSFSKCDQPLYNQSNGSEHDGTPFSLNGKITPGSSDDFEPKEEDEEDDNATEKEDDFVCDENVDELVSTVSRTSKDGRECDLLFNDSSTAPDSCRSSSECIPFFPPFASPKAPRNSRSYNEEFPGDIMLSMSSGQRLSSRKSQNKFDQKTSFSNLPPTHLAPFERLCIKEDKSTLSSIDAFEASFNIDFPDSFSRRENDNCNVCNIKKNNASNANSSSEGDETYNPFLSPNEKNKKPNSSSHRPSLSVRPAWTCSRVSADPPGKDKTSPKQREKVSTNSVLFNTTASTTHSTNAVAKRSPVSINSVMAKFSSFTGNSPSSSKKVKETMSDFSDYGCESESVERTREALFPSSQRKDATFFCTHEYEFTSMPPPVESDDNQNNYHRKMTLTAATASLSFRQQTRPVPPRSSDTETLLSIHLPQNEKGDAGVIGLDNNSDKVVQDQRSTSLEVFAIAKPNSNLSFGNDCDKDLDGDQDDNKHQDPDFLCKDRVVHDDGNDLVGLPLQSKMEEIRKADETLLSNESVEASLAVIDSETEMDSFMISTPQGSPAAESKFRPSISNNDADVDAYRTPPPSTLHCCSPTSCVTTGSDVPSRPEKAGHDQARAKFEKALQGRHGHHGLPRLPSQGVFSLQSVDYDKMVHGDRSLTAGGSCTSSYRLSTVSTSDEIMTSRPFSTSISGSVRSLTSSKSARSLKEVLSSSSDNNHYENNDCSYQKSKDSFDTQSLSDRDRNRNSMERVSSINVFHVNAQNSAESSFANSSLENRHSFDRSNNYRTEDEPDRPRKFKNTAAWKEPIHFSELEMEDGDIPLHSNLSKDSSSSSPSSQSRWESRFHNSSSNLQRNGSLTTAAGVGSCMSISGRSRLLPWERKSLDNDNGISRFRQHHHPDDIIGHSDIKVGEKFIPLPSSYQQQLPSAAMYSNHHHAVVSSVVPPSLSLNIQSNNIFPFSTTGASVEKTMATTFVRRRSWRDQFTSSTASER